jgi:acetoin utilization deacetylase AcuC-like enzyme
MTTALISHPVCYQHAMTPGHPERPERLRAIEAALDEQALLDHLDVHEAPRAMRAQLERVHDPDYIDTIYRLAPADGLIPIDADTAMNPCTLEAALRAAGAAVHATELVMTGGATRAFCSVRPPGHHAERARAMGFCFFDNVAVAAAHALEAFGLERVAVADFDVHFGNGTHDIFRTEERVLICQTYQYPLYPFADPPSAPGHIVNVALPDGSGGAAFRDAVTRRWLPELARFEPQLIFISAGFDGHAADPLAGLRLVESDYQWVTAQLVQLARQWSDGRIVSTLEGGYELSALGRSAAAHISALMVD